jgi:hypothetical protein
LAMERVRCVEPHVAFCDPLLCSASVLGGLSCCGYCSSACLSWILPLLTCGSALTGTTAWFLCHVVPTWTLCRARVSYMFVRARIRRHWLSLFLGLISCLSWRILD